MRIFISIFGLAFLTFALVLSCDKLKDEDDDPKPETDPDAPSDTNSGSLAVSVTDNAIDSLPAYSVVSSSYDATVSGELLPGTLVIDSTPLHLFSGFAEGDVVDDFALRTFFRYECFGGYGARAFNYCPSSLDLPPSNNTENYPYSFTTTALMGNIEGAEGFMRRVYPFKPDVDKCADIETAKGATCDACYSGQPQSCRTEYSNSDACFTANKCMAENKCTNWYYCNAESGSTTAIAGGKPFTTDQYSIKSTTAYGDVADSTGDGSSYFVGLEGLYNRHASTGEESFLYHSSEDQKKFAMIYTSKHMEGMAGAGVGRNHMINQAFLSLGETGEGKILAANSMDARDREASTEVSARRSVLLQNFANGRFIVKYRHVDIGPANGSEVIAIGKGGRDENTGELKAGYYYVEVHRDEQHIVTGCIDNSSQKLVADTNCSTEKTLWDGSFDVVSYLDLSSDEKTDLASYIEFLDDATRITDSQMATSSADVVNFPDEVTPD